MYYKELNIAKVSELYSIKALSTK